MGAYMNVSFLRADAAEGGVAEDSDEAELSTVGW
jgi:hypothetical protein